MSEFALPKLPLSSLKGKVIVVTGGASGIGDATVTLLHSFGAHVVFGDISTEAGNALASKLNNTNGNLESEGGSAKFVVTDVRSYRDIYKLFRTAHDTHGGVDHAISCAGILERGKFFDPELTIDSVAEEDDEARGVLHTNLGGACAVARIAVVFLRERRQQHLKAGVAEADVDVSLSIVASVTSIRESAGMFMYQTSKTGILGLLRAMRTLVYDRDGIRTNICCPGVTESAMTAKVIGKFRERNLATQTSAEVARILAAMTSETRLKVVEKDQSGRDTQPEVLNGKAFYVEGGRAFEFEKSLWDTMPSWLGTDASAMLKTNAEFVASGVLLRDD